MSFGTKVSVKPAPEDGATLHNKSLFAKYIFLHEFIVNVCKNVCTPTK